MKKLITLALISMIAFAGCSSTPENIENTLKEDATLESIYTAVDAKFKETHGEDFGVVPMEMPVDKVYLSDFAGIDETMVEEVFGNTAGSMTNSDTFFGVKAVEGQTDAVKAGLEKRIKDIEAQFEMYPVSGSYDRALAGEVYQKGDYLFLIVVGFLEMDVEVVDFSGDVAMTKEIIDSMFN